MGASTNLPPERTPLIGRASERAAITRALDEGARLVTLVGSPGIGKTRLAGGVAADVVVREGGGVWFCDLTDARTPGDLASRVAAVLGVPARGADAGRQLLRALAARGPTLLLLDNFEGLLPAGPALLDGWLDSAAALQLLVTSRVRLGIDGETVFEVGPLAPDDAARLYETRARAAWADRPVEPGDEAAIADLVERLDRIPLAIELAAARVRVLPPAALVERLGDRFAILKGPRLGRHASLEEAIACSFDLLSPGEREVLLQAAVFRGGFDLEAAAGVIRPGGEAPPLLDLLEGLREKSLLRLEAGRFRLYESVREFAAAQLAQAGGAAAVEERHAAFFMEAAEAWAEATSGPKGVEATRALLADRENLLAAFERSFATHPGSAARIALALGAGLALNGPIAAEVELLDRALDAARRADDELLLARLLCARGAACTRQGHLEAAGANLLEARRLAPVGSALAYEIHVESARLHCALGAFDAAREALAAAGEELPAPGAWLQGRARTILGMVEERAGRHDASAAAFEEALAFMRASGNVRHHGIAILNLAVARAGGGRLDEARAMLEEALVLLRRAQDRASEAAAIVDLGSVELSAGRLDEAERHLRGALQLERQLGDMRFEALALGNLGLVALERGAAAQGWGLLREATELLHACGETRYRALFLPFYAAAAARLGHLDQARADFGEARAVFEALGDRASLCAVDRLEGLLDLACGDRAGARARLEKGGGLVSPELLIASRLLQTALDGGGGEALEVAEGGAAFRLAGGAEIDLRRRGPLRRLLDALVEQRLERPGVGLPAEALFELGWPGERILPSAASNRVYNGIRSLRAMGLEAVLRRNADGYLLDPEVPLRRLRG